MRNKRSIFQRWCSRCYIIIIPSYVWYCVPTISRLSFWRTVLFMGNSWSHLYTTRFSRENAKYNSYVKRKDISTLVHFIAILNLASSEYILSQPHPIPMEHKMILIRNLVYVIKLHQLRIAMGWQWPRSVILGPDGY